MTEIALGNQHMSGDVGGIEQLVIDPQVVRGFLGRAPRRVDVPLGPGPGPCAAPPASCHADAIGPVAKA
jgi:hypothetical protein